MLLLCVDAALYSLGMVTKVLDGIEVLLLAGRVEVVLDGGIVGSPQINDFWLVLRDMLGDVY
jgi:hypothetical protein